MISSSDVISSVAIVISLIAFLSTWRGSMRSRQEANILTLTGQINDIYNMVDPNLARVLETRGKEKLEKGHDRERFLMLQKLHIHLDSLKMMIMMEGSAFHNRLFGKLHNGYYVELIGWYCSVHKFYNDLLDFMGIEDSSFLHDGMKDPHRTHGSPPLFLMNNRHARRYHSQVDHGALKRM